MRAFRSDLSRASGINRRLEAALSRRQRSSNQESSQTVGKKSGNEPSSTGMAREMAESNGKEVVKVDYDGRLLHGTSIQSIEEKKVMIDRSSVARARLLDPKYQTYGVGAAEGRDGMVYLGVDNTRISRVRGPRSHPCFEIVAHQANGFDPESTGKYDKQTRCRWNPSTASCRHLRYNPTSESVKPLTCLSTSLFCIKGPRN